MTVGRTPTSERQLRGGQRKRAPCGHHCTPPPPSPPAMSWRVPHPSMRMGNTTLPGRTAGEGWWWCSKTCNTSMAAKRGRWWAQPQKSAVRAGDTKGHCTSTSRSSEGRTPPSLLWRRPHEGRPLHGSCGISHAPQEALGKTQEALALPLTPTNRRTADENSGQTQSRWCHTLLVIRFGLGHVTTRRAQAMLWLSPVQMDAWGHCFVTGAMRLQDFLGSDAWSCRTNTAAPQWLKRWGRVEMTDRIQQEYERFSRSVATLM